MAWVGPQPESGETEVSVSVQSEDLESLLVCWLQELLFLFQHRQCYFVDTRSIEVGATAARAILRCRNWEERRAQDYQEIKAITYHQLSLTRNDEGWQAHFIVDI